MTSTTATTAELAELGNGWLREGQSLIWTDEPLHASEHEDHAYRDVLRLSFWHRKDGSDAKLRIETGFVAGSSSYLASREAIADALEDANDIELPVAALPELAYRLVAVLMRDGRWSEVIDRIEKDQQATSDYLDKLLKAAGGNINATVGEAEAALKAQEGDDA